MRPEEIRRRRKAWKLSQKQLAALAEVQQSMISAVERGGRIGDESRDRIIAVLKGSQPKIAPPAPKPRAPQPAAEPNAPPPPGDSPGMGTLATNSADVLELALTRAIDHTRHLIRDATAVLDAYSGTTLPQVSAAELDALASRWLDAAAELRREGATVDAQSLSARVSLRALRAH